MLNMSFSTPSKCTSLSVLVGEKCGKVSEKREALEY